MITGNVKRKLMKFSIQPQSGYLAIFEIVSMT